MHRSHPIGWYDIWLLLSLTACTKDVVIYLWFIFLWLVQSLVQRIHIMTIESCWSKINVNPLSRRCRDDVYAWRRVRRGHMITHFWPHAVECRAVTLPRRETHWNLQGCPKLTKRSQPLVGRSSPYYGDMWRRYCCLTRFFRLSTYALVAKI